MGTTKGAIYARDPKDNQLKKIPLLGMTNYDDGPIQEKVAKIESLAGDREYNQKLPNGMGYIILDKTKTFAEQVISPNTIYEIRYDFDLGGQTVTIPENCTLKFEGGTLNGGIIIGNNTSILSSITQIFENIKFEGVFNCEYSFPEWFGEHVNNIADADKLGEVRLSGGKIYYVDKQICIHNGVIGSKGIPTLMSGGSRSLKGISVVAYIGDGNDIVTEGSLERQNSVFLVNNSYGVSFENFCIICTQKQKFNITDNVYGVINKEYTDYESGNLRRLKNEKFSAIKFTTDNGMGFRFVRILNCMIWGFPIGVNFYDLRHEIPKSQWGSPEYNKLYGQYDVNTDEISIKDCLFSNEINLNIENENTYETVIEKCLFEGHFLKRHINLIKGHLLVIGAWFSPAEKEYKWVGIKACLYCENTDGKETSDSDYTLIRCYAENHNMYFLYDISSAKTLSEQNPKQIIGCYARQTTVGAPVYGYKYTVIVDGVPEEKVRNESCNIMFDSKNQKLNIIGGLFTNYICCEDNSYIADIAAFQSRFYGCTKNVFDVASNSYDSISTELNHIGNQKGELYLGNRDTHSFMKIIANNDIMTLDFPGKSIMSINAKDKVVNFSGLGILTKDFVNVPGGYKSSYRGNIGHAYNEENGKTSVLIVGGNKQIYDALGNLYGSKRRGTSNEKPDKTVLSDGFYYFDTTKNKMLFLVNGLWQDVNGATEGYN